MYWSRYRQVKKKTINCINVVFFFLKLCSNYETPQFWHLNIHQNLSSFWHKEKNPIRTPEKTKRGNQIDVVWILLGFSVALVAKLISDKNVCKDTFVELPETIS